MRELLPASQNEGVPVTPERRFPVRGLRPIEVTSLCYRVAGKPVYLHSGEFHYFRVPRKDWRRRMRLFKSVGGNCLATYIPWLLHEPEEGRFLFESRDGRLNVEEFLETAAEEGLYVVARPGPYQYSELIMAGLPTWLPDKHPEVLARRLDGTIIRDFSVSYMHPRFLELARRWYAQVCPVVARHTVSRGGPVAFAQFDNEMVGIQYWFGSIDFNPETFGFGREDGRYGAFLKQRHGTVEAMNRAYGTAFASWVEARPLYKPSPASPCELRRSKDFLDLYLAQVAEYAKTLVGWMREFGIDTPMVHNSAGPYMNVLFRETARALGPGFVLGSDHYYNLDQNWAQNNPTPQYAAHCFFSVESLREMGVPPTVFELPGGSCSDWPPVGANDLEAAYLVNAAVGMKGSNYYILTGGPNPPGAGTTTDLYDYGAPIGPRNEVRPHLASVRKLGALYGRNPWLLEALPDHDLRIVWDYECGRWPYYASGGTDHLFVGDAVREFGRRGVLSTAFCAGLTPAMRDASTDGWEDDTTTPILVVCASTQARAIQERVVRFLRNGGRALIAPVLPQYDENMNPCTVLAEFLGAAPATRLSSTRVRVSFPKTRNVLMNGDLFAWDAIPAGAKAIGVEEWAGKTVAWSAATKGGGRALVLGMRWHHAVAEHHRMLAELLAGLGLRRRLTCSSQNVWCFLRTAGKGRSMLFAVNLFVSPQEAEIACRPSWSRKTIQVGRVRLPPMTVRAFALRENGTAARVA